MSERDAFGGHGETIKAIREHREWHDDITGAGADWEGSLHGRSVTCWKEAEYVRVLLAEVDRLTNAADLNSAQPLDDETKKIVREDWQADPGD